MLEQSTSYLEQKSVAAEKLDMNTAPPSEAEVGGEVDKKHRVIVINKNLIAFILFP
jgi:hypothetical protein